MFKSVTFVQQRTRTCLAGIRIHPARLTTPPRLWCPVRATDMLNAEPWLKPMSTIRRESIPTCICDSISLLIISTDSRVPPSSNSSSAGGRDTVSNQQGRSCPWWTDTGRLGLHHQNESNWVVTCHACQRHSHIRLWNNPADIWQFGCQRFDDDRLPGCTWFTCTLLFEMIIETMLCPVHHVRGWR